MNDRLRFRVWDKQNGCYVYSNNSDVDILYIETGGDLTYGVYNNDDEKIKEYEAHQTPVPSYEEWQASEKYNKHLEEVIKIYERKDKQATETSIAYNELLEENTKLKELLEECRHIIGIEKDFATCHFEEYTLVELLTKIDEVLK